MAGPVPRPEPTEGRHPGWPARLGPLVVEGGGVALRPPRLRDATDWSGIRLRDREYLRRWEPSGGDWQQRNAASAWFGQWASLRGMARRGHVLPFVITLDGVLVGQLTVGNIIRGALRSGWVGYWVSSAAAGNGVATAALALAADHCFGPVGLHRLEATVRPENASSVRVLEKAAFRREGLFERYLDVAGAWRDHLVYALTAEEVPEGVESALIRSGRVRRP
ncbi:ribosomal-protein-alanine N-acetyltransferase [Actinopolyspora biskrensis]|uniref:Ribosomal-protein-alanine N-acetyltransferase n=1 Tax=Actinopolyspora biskrensis TaxID=1470178 RepID=A0A852Z9S5_9ACTN|nr:GNAT family protein [Actinopolyspora biskrensis]NYH79297.1 ribosomal-protein-alanine N-acetyltransferase [Actinopolyspora biskrensis]